MKSKKFLDFFAGSGLVTLGMKPYFKATWANDISKRKANVYRENNHSEPFLESPIEEVKGEKLPSANLAWASFPCIDLSLAGKLEGINGKQSGLVWHWLRILDEMKEKPPILVVENVVGLISADRGVHYQALHIALSERGYKVGPMILDAVKWLPHSRPRVFIVAVIKSLNIKGLYQENPGSVHHESIQKVTKNLNHLIWWKLQEPSTTKRTGLSDIVQYDAPCHDKAISDRNIRMIPQNHYERLKREIKNGLRVAPGYKRMRNGKQVLELRFDDIAGCLRTPQGGSSRQYLVLHRKNELRTRLLTVRETARLMGAPDDFILPGTYNDGYAAMGDAVAVPVTKYISKHLLQPLAERT
ncbi:MAG: DNA cytosine methyltransferase [bacterium]|nr:DNA cytosine methyltransferase [bacterium]